MIEWCLTERGGREGLPILRTPMGTPKATCTRLRHQSWQHSHLPTIVPDNAVFPGPSGRQSKNHIHSQL